jgi:hypothetical protein
VVAKLFYAQTEVGYFHIKEGVTMDMSISIDEAHQKKGYSRHLIRAVCEAIELPDTKRLYIDTDASEGYWVHLGLQANPLYDFDESMRDMEGAGYEMFITFADLKAFASCMDKKILD